MITDLIVLFFGMFTGYVLTKTGHADIFVQHVIQLIQKKEEKLTYIEIATSYVWPK